MDGFWLLVWLAVVIFIVVKFVGFIWKNGMGEYMKGAGAGAERTAAPVAQQQRAPKMTAKQLADKIHAEHPDGIESMELWNIARTHGVDVQDVERRLDAMRVDGAITRKTVKLDGLNLVDLRGLDTIRQKVKGFGYYINESNSRDTRHLGGDKYALIREPDNEHDRFAIAVHAMTGRKLGHVSASRAAILAPEFDRIGADGYIVAGGSPDVGRRIPSLDLPTAAAIRSFAASWPADEPEVD